jgi:hypothetical protein
MAGPSWINRELTYVQASRARKEIHIFCDEVTAGHERSGLIQRMAISQKKGSIADAIEERRERAEARKLKLSEPQEKNTLPRQREARKFEHSPSA